MATYHQANSFMTFWGKAEAHADTKSVHLLPFHCLDVAAVGRVFLKQNRRIRGILARLTGLEEAHFAQCMVFFLALHDIGKFAESFQNLRPNLLKRLQDRKSDKGYGLRHDTLGFLIWKEHLKSYLLGIGCLPGSSTSRRRIRETGYDYWMRAIAGHHGEPPKEENRRILDFFGEQDIKAVKDYAGAVIKLLFEDGRNLPDVDKAQLRTASWWLGGLAVLCDWLGSNTAYFPACGHEMPLDRYWRRALERAEHALASTELMVDIPETELHLQDLFEPDLEDPTPLQAACGEIVVGEGPGLYILEDVTGAGKTEAAVLLAHRLMIHGKGAGFYFALPTMATANAMFKRMQMVYGRLFPSKTQPSLVLAHSARNLSQAFRQAVLPVPKTKEIPYGDTTVPAGAHCSAWLADNPKKALLAAVGVGTVDQALLGILPSRHQGLRLLGMMDKVLIVDEVHACDAYMHTLLKVLLRAQAIAGGSVILLSATLSNYQRQALVDAFAEGISVGNGILQKTGKSDYPLFTSFAGGDLREINIDTRKEVRRYVNVEMVHKLEQVEDVVKQAVEAGHCVCWIRNTVAEARQGYASLRRKFPGWSIDLFHARFALADRLEIEERIVRDFGKNSTAKQRKGRVVVATQVIEQSLDVDFDVMVTDLAPIDLIIQRAGRLCRHCRDQNGNRVEGADQRGTPVLNVLSPESVEQPDANWYEALFPQGAWVYPNHGQLWLTARLLNERAGFDVPGDVREMTEIVFGETGAVIPDRLQEKTFEAEGQDWADISVAELNALNLKEGYSAASSNRWWDEALTPTRLGEPTTTVYLGRWEGEHLSSWIDGDQGWQRSAVQIRTARIAEEAGVGGPQHIAMETCKEQLPAKGKWGVLVPLECVDGATWRGMARNEKGEETFVYYVKERGLMTEDEMRILNEREANESD